MGIVIGGKDATPEQAAAIKKLGKKYMFKTFGSVIHCVLIALAMNFLLVMAVATYAENSSALPFVGGLAIGIFIIRRLRSALVRNAAGFAEEVKKIAQQ